MRRLGRRLRANLHYLRMPVLRFLPQLALLGAVMAVGATAFRYLYHEKDLGWSESMFVVWTLLFSEQAYEYPRHWGVRIFFWLLPPLGMIVVLDAIIRFSYHILRRDDTGREWNRAMSQTMRNHVILCGLGKLGLRVLEQLLQLKEDVVVLEKDPLCPNIAFARKHAVPVLIGSGREDGILDDLNVARAKSIIVATNDDLANLELSLDAKKANPGIRVVLRLFDQELASKVRESFDISLAFSTSALAAPLFATSSSDRSIINSFYIRDKLLVVANIEVRTGSTLVGKKVRELRAQDRTLVVAHERGEAVAFFPDGDTLLQPGDRISVQTDPQKLQELHRWNNDPEPF